MLEADDDFARVIDGLVAATLVRAAGARREALAHALMRPLRSPPADQRARTVSAAEAVWHLAAAELAEPPRPGDAIEDGQGRRWTVHDVRRTGLDGRWRCLARDVAAAYALDQYVDVWRAGPGPESGGAEIWLPWRTGLRARVQPVIAQIDQRSDGPSLRAQFEILLEGDPGLDAQCRIAGPDGTQYALSIVRAGRAAEPLCAEVVRIDAF